jgi:7-cyano-7-deazaguanine reductase
MTERLYLGQSISKPIAAESLDVVPWVGSPTAIVRFECAEFTSHCPVTGQPDFASLSIEYGPTSLLVETKSLKLYLWSYRTAHAFNEVIVDEIAASLFRVLSPRFVEVRGHFHARGGISVHPTVRLVGPEAAP